MFTNIRSNKAFIAVYEEIPVEMIPIKFVDYDGRVIKSESIKKGSTAVPPADPIREGYDFMGWDINVYHNVTFKDYNGTILKKDSVVNGGEVTPPQIPIRPGYEFVRWNDK